MNPIIEDKKKTLEEWLSEVDYAYLNDGGYVPSQFALVFANFIKLVNGESGEENKTPPVHLKMLDKLTSKKKYIANLCFRGMGKTAVFFEYLVLFIAVFQSLPGLKDISGMIYVSDSMDNGVKTARKNIEHRYYNSEFLQEWVPHAHFTDAYIEFENKDGHKLGVKLFGAKALALDTFLYKADGSITTIGSCRVGDVIIGADGMPTTITEKSEVFNKDMYELVLRDGRRLKVSHDHWNQVWVKKFKSERTFSTHTFEEGTFSTDELLSMDMFAIDPSGSRRPLLWIEDIEPIQWPTNEDLLIDPYTVGVLLGDGSMNTKGAGTQPVCLTSHNKDWPTYEKNIPYALGKKYTEGEVTTRTVKGISDFVKLHKLNTHGNEKKIPIEYLMSSVEQRLALLQGLMDTDGTSTKEGKSLFSSNSKYLVDQVIFLVRSLGGQASWSSTGKDTHYRAYIRLNMPLHRLERKLKNQKQKRDNKVAIVAINKIPSEPSQCIAVDNEIRQFVAGKGLVRTHNTGLRGTKVFGKRPVLAVLDDLVSDDDAKSQASMQSIKDTIDKGVDFALHPTKKKVIFNGTPFNKSDILIEAVESGAWDVNVWPVCERFPCTKEEFQGAWEDRFTYEFVKDTYDRAKKAGKLNAFYQELMLQITSEEERLIQDGEIGWYSRKDLLNNRSNFNFYITTDFATSAKQKADFTVISVWAYGAGGDWFWVDGSCERETLDKTMDRLFNYAAEYRPLQVGIETNGQQAGFIPWIKKEQLSRNIWFSFASNSKTGEPGVRSVNDKLTKFSMMVPMFKLGKIHFPEEMKESKVIGEFLTALRLATVSGLKGKDDTIDTISQLQYLKPVLPQSGINTYVDSSGVWGINSPQTETTIGSYIV